MDSGQKVEISISPETIREIALGHTDRALTDAEIDQIALAVEEGVQEAAQEIYDEAIESVIRGG